MPLTASDILKQRKAQDMQDMERAFKNEWNTTIKRPGSVEVRNRALNTLHATYKTRAEKLLEDYREKERGNVEIALLAEKGMLNADRVDELQMQAVLGSDVAGEMYPEGQSFEQLDVRRGKIKSELAQFELGRQDERGAFFTEPETRDTSKGLRWPWPFQGRHRVPTTAGGVYTREPYYTMEKGREVERFKHRPATQEEMQRYAELQQSDKEAARLQTAALRSSRMLGRSDPFAEKAVGDREINDPLGLGL